MPYENNRSIPFTPVAAAVRQNRFVSIGTAGAVDESGAGVDAIGVSLEASPAATQTVIPVLLLDGGKTEVEAGAAVIAGVRVMSDSEGRAITAVGATVRVLGWSLSATGAAGEILTIVGRPAAGEFVA
jgi:hypothetical protein